MRLRRMSAAAIATMMRTAAPTAMYVVVGVALVGGTITGLGVGATVMTGVGVGFAVGLTGVADGGGAVMTTAGDAAAVTETAYVALDLK